MPLNYLLLINIILFVAYNVTLKYTLFNIYLKLKFRRMYFSSNCSMDSLILMLETGWHTTGNLSDEFYLDNPYLITPLG